MDTPAQERVLTLDRYRELASATLTGLGDPLLVEAVLPSVQNRHSQVQNQLGVSKSLLHGLSKDCLYGEGYFRPRHHPPAESGGWCFAL